MDGTLIEDGTLSGADLLMSNAQTQTDTSANYVSPYVTYYKADGSEAAYDGSDKDNISTAVFDEQVPVLIRPSSVDFTFYNYIDKQSFSPSD
jgi:hypothetical protein